MLCVKRSAAKVCWHLLCNGIVIKAGEKQECLALQGEFARKYGLTITK